MLSIPAKHGSGRYYADEPTLDRLEADGVVRGYTASIDPGRFGWGTHAFVALSCEGRMAAAEVREAAALEAFRVAEARKAIGQLPLTEHLLARRLLAESQAAVARVRYDRIGAQVDLIKALGGARVEAAAK